MKTVYDICSQVREKEKAFERKFGVLPSRVYVSKFILDQMGKELSENPTTKDTEELNRINDLFVFQVIEENHVEVA